MKKGISLAIALFSAAAAMPCARAMGPKPPSPEEIEKQKQEDARLAAEKALELRKQKVRALEREIRLIDVKFRTDSTRCQKAQQLTGDSLENVAAQINGRIDWTVKCLRERVARSEAEMTPELKNLIRNRPAEQSPEYDRMQDLVDADPAYHMNVLFDSQVRVVNSLPSIRGQHGNFMYPVWAVPGETSDSFSNPANWRAPVDPNAGCGLIPEYKGRRELEFYHPLVMCEAGCFAEGSRILGQSGWQDAALYSNAKDRGRGLVTLSAGSSLDRASFALTPIESIVRSAEAEDEEMVEIATVFGRILTVTTNHPMLKADGMMVPAGQLAEGDLLLASDGDRVEQDAVASLKGFTRHEKVTNFRMSSENLHENVVIAEGLLTGTSMYQNELRDQVNRGMMRVLLPSSLISTRN